MAVQNINNPLGAGGIERRDRIAGRREAEHTERTEEHGRVQQRNVANLPEQETAARPAHDVYQSTEESRLAAELTENIAENEPEPREETVNRARERVRNGYYNTREFISSLAMKLINTGNNNP